MKINYSPYFDSTVYIDYSTRGKTLVDEQYLGDVGLLSEMELRLGLTRFLPSDESREVDFYKVLDGYLKSHSDSFIKRSFDLDPLSVSKELLRWRDELILCGWDTKFHDSNKLRLLADVENLLPEKSSVKSGYGDRWQYVLKAPKGSLRNIKIVVHFPDKYVAPHIQKLFGELKDIEYCNYSTPIAKEKKSDLHGVQVSLIEETGGIEISGDGSIKVIEFDDYTQAIEWVGASNRKENTVIVNKDNRRLDDFQISMSNSTSGASLSSTNPEVAQLFKLGCSLLIEPVNIYNLLSYLQVSVNPLPFRLRKKLIEVITEEGGILNDKWNQEIESYLKELDDDGKINSKKKRKKLTLLPVGGERRSDTVSVEAIKKYVTELSNWASQRKALVRDGSKSVLNPELVIAQLGALVDFCSSLLSVILNVEGEFISNELLERWLRTIYRPKNYPYSKPELECLTVVPSPASFADCSQNLVWLDCFAADQDRNPIAFLTNQEFNYLTENGAYPWKWTEQIEARMFSFKMAVLLAGESLTLVVSGSDTGKQLPKHPLVTTIMELCSESSKDRLVFAANNFDEGKLVSVCEEPLSEPITYVQLKDGLGFTPRLTESYSSLEKLIEYPIDYVLHYMLWLRDNSTQSITNLNLTIGNVAHLVVETLVERFQNPNQVLAKIDEEFDRIFDDSVTRVGAILLLKENIIECSRVRGVTKESVRKLFGFIQDNSLEIVGSEVESLCESEIGFKLDSKADLVCKTLDGRLVIFDLKWTTNRTKHRKLLEEGKTLQLSLYRYAMENVSGNQKVAATAYFLLSFGEVVSNDFPLKSSKSEDGLTEKIWESYGYRWAELNAGTVEVAEAVDVEQLQYYVETEAENLVPITTGKKEKGITPKYPNYYSSYNTLKGGLK